MPSLPANTTYGIVTGRIITAVGDTPSDVDNLPDAVPATGTVTFTPSVRLVRNSIAKTVMVPRPVVTHLDGEGYLVMADGITSFGGPRDIYLVASDNTGMDPKNWSYTVSFEVIGANGVPLDLPSFDITVLANTRFDLSDLVPTVGQIVSVAAATALAAQAAASAAAAQASADAAAAKAGSGGNDENAMHFRGPWAAPFANDYVDINFMNGMPSGMNFFGNAWTIVDKTDPEQTGYTKALKSPALANNATANLRFPLPAKARTDSPSYLYSLVSSEAGVGKWYPNSAPMRSGIDTAVVEDIITPIAGATNLDFTYSKGATAGGPVGDDAVYIWSLYVAVTPTPLYQKGDVVTYGGKSYIRTAPASSGSQSTPPSSTPGWVALS